MDDLSNEEHEALLLMCGHAVGPPLSPAAKAVLDAFTGNDTIHGLHLITPRLAAVLRAAADQLLAATWEGAIPANTTHMLGINWSRDALHAIANELEAND